MFEYAKANQKAWDTKNLEGIEWSVPITHEAYQQVKAGVWDVCLTSTKMVPREWFGPFEGKRILGLGSGGGQQMPVFQALGAEVTVLDYSEKQLENEAMVARREGYDIRLVHADMSQPLPFEDAAFDMIFHPVSNVYVEDVEPIWRECARVIKQGGLLLAGLVNPLVFLFDSRRLKVRYRLPFGPASLSKREMAARLKQNEVFQFSHSLTELIGGQLRAGFSITHFYEDYHKEGWHPIGDYTPTHFATRAVKL